MKASGRNETKQVDQDQPKDKGSRKSPKSRDEGCRETLRSTTRRTERAHQQSTKAHKSTEGQWQPATDLGVSHRRSNEHQKGG
jgi:hypothetical protein